MKKAFWLIGLVVIMGIFPHNPARAEDGGNGITGNTGYTGSEPLPYRVYLPAIQAEIPSVPVCIVPDNSGIPSCELVDVVNHTSMEDGYKPVYRVTDEGFYNQLWIARQFTIDGYYYHIDAWTTIYNPQFPLNLDDQWGEAFLYLYMDGNVYLLELIGGMIYNDNITDY